MGRSRRARRYASLLQQKLLSLSEEVTETNTQHCLSQCYLYPHMSYPLR